jgi:hypothetical protein
MPCERTSGMLTACCAVTSTGLVDTDLQTRRKTNWGEHWPAERILWVMIAHDCYHGGQNRTMRAFYRSIRHA